MTDTDVIIVGAGPTGLMLAAELRLAGVRPLVLERQPRLREAPKANGLGGQILELLRYRGLLDRLEAAGNRPVSPAPRVPVRRRAPGLLRPGRSADPGGARSRNRSSSACSTSTPANSAPRSAAGTRWSGSARTTPR